MGFSVLKTFCFNLIFKKYHFLEKHREHAEQNRQIQEIHHRALADDYLTNQNLVQLIQMRFTKITKI